MSEQTQTIDDQGNVVTTSTTPLSEVIKQAQQQLDNIKQMQETLASQANEIIVMLQNLVK